MLGKAAVSECGRVVKPRLPNRACQAQSGERQAALQEEKPHLLPPEQGVIAHRLWRAQQDGTAQLNAKVAAAREVPFRVAAELEEVEGCGKGETPPLQLTLEALLKVWPAVFKEGWRQAQYPQTFRASLPLAKLHKGPEPSNKLKPVDQFTRSTSNTRFGMSPGPLGNPFPSFFQFCCHLK